jgi:hypothetical protein
MERREKDTQIHGERYRHAHIHNTYERMRVSHMACFFLMILTVMILKIGVLFCK